MTDLLALDPSMYTYSQEKVLFWIGKPNCLLGILGSLYICGCIARDVSRRQQTFRRLLFSVSAGHILLCVCMALLTIPMPRGSHYAAFGTDQTCKAMGFVTHFAFSFCLYGHAEMGFYYIFTFFRGWSERQFQQRIEPILHVTALLYPLLGAIIGIATDMYGPNELLLQCWVQREVTGRTYFIIFAGLIELNYFTIFKQISLVGIAYSVYKQERRMVLRYSVTTETNTNSTRSSTNSNANIDPKNSLTATATSTRKKVSPPQSVLVARETLIQASIFFLSCFIPYAIMMIMRYFDLFWVNIPDDGKVPPYLFGLSAAAQFLYPLQGVVAMIAFVRPDYCKIRRGLQNQPLSFPHLLWQTILFQTGWGQAEPQDLRHQSVTPPKMRHSTILKTIQQEFAKNLQQEIPLSIKNSNLNRNSDTTQSSTSYAAEMETVEEGVPIPIPVACDAELEANEKQKDEVRDYTLSGFMDWSCGAMDEENLAFEEEFDEQETDK